MINIDRMELEDVGGNPVRLAQSLLAQLPNISLPIPVREIAVELGIYEIREEKTKGFEGALITTDDKSEGAIIVHRDRPETRKRYTIGHELGHYLNPWHKTSNPAGFQCTAKNLSEEYSKKDDRLTKMEVEANIFSSELLMPAEQIRNYLKSNPEADLEQIVELSENYNVSKEAMARRYVEKNDLEPAAIVFSKENKIRYVKKHSEFPWLNVRNGDQLPSGSISHNDHSPVGDITPWKESRPGIWVDEKPDLVIFEQTIAQLNDYRMTLLTHELVNDDDENDGPSLEEGWTPKFAYNR